VSPVEKKSTATITPQEAVQITNELM